MLTDERENICHYHTMKKDRRENLTVHDTKAPFNGRFDLAWLSTDLFPPSGLEIVAISCYEPLVDLIDFEGIGTDI